MSATGTRLAKLRVLAGLSQRQLATLAGVTGGYISLLESGTRPGLGFAAARKIARVLGSTAEYLAFGEGKAPDEATIKDAVARARRSRRAA